ncbi:MAG TPA: hypothetical protein DEG17_02460 [Cyanobacteria bacterium UBA11149]|nr:hypothetical protein [Cyanobacteria bacterium UBA11367]HBE61015.1 hypothetical protein [Cyanobacteria bacterium UBA11366]HBK63815.1 hypothetical protein [Cyanobacteria bacterium UBA11166]HBR74289.1 hypothetical protein [Cyanobacteria bacterium UBA11159]HBS71076.1 hypothetical protein [Cyanobacteria bacterium UBA11153]HBW87769.1 hypothetical protein [Cyanobacteria bacterium UBA11149]HCA93215.1 hypothetical protein [Cyanobacteria bacterium UBA9226]
MLPKPAKIITYASLVLLTLESLAILPGFAQSAQQDANPNSTIDGDFNNVFQVPNQNNAQNSNINEFNIPNIYPLDNPINTPVNTENDFGFNMSVGVNTLDASNVTVYFGVIYQPGRTNSHRVRMNYLNQQTELIEKQTELLESQRQIAETRLQLLQNELKETESRLQRLQQSPGN